MRLLIVSEFLTPGAWSWDLFLMWYFWDSSLPEFSIDLTFGVN